MDHKKYNQTDPWDEQMYGTGNTMPPKSHGGLIALLLMLVIFLSGIISVLSFLNIRLFQELSARNETSDPVSMAFAQLDETAPEAESIPPAPGSAARQELSLKLHDSPQSVENIPQEGGLSLQDIYTMNIPSVVSISCSGMTDTTTGTGVILSESGYILTNFHVVEDAETISVTLSDQRILTGLLIGADKLTDLAILYVDAADLTPAQFGDSAALRVGDAVAAIGDPLGAQLQGSMTNGIISAINRNVTVNGYSIELIQTNAALNAGNSGGPLINCYGQVIGINTMKITQSGGASSVEGVGFAIPSATVKEIVDQLLSQGYVSGRPTLGLAGDSITKFDQHYFHVPAGLFLTEVEPDSSAALQGIEPGDILILLENQPVQTQQELDTIVYSHHIGDDLDAVIYRNGVQYGLTLTITEATG